MTQFTVALSVAVTTASGIEEKITIPSTELNSALIKDIQGRLIDLVSGSNQIQPADNLTINGSITSTDGASVHINGATVTAQHVEDFFAQISEATQTEAEPAPEPEV